MLFVLNVFFQAKKSVLELLSFEHRVHIRINPRINLLVFSKDVRRVTVRAKGLIQNKYKLIFFINKATWVGGVGNICETKSEWICQLKLEATLISYWCLYWVVYCGKSYFSVFFRPRTKKTPCTCHFVLLLVVFSLVYHQL